MISIKRCREILGEKYTDEEIEKIRKLLYELAEVEGLLKQGNLRKGSKTSESQTALNETHTVSGAC